MKKAVAMKIEDEDWAILKMYAHSKNKPMAKIIKEYIRTLPRYVLDENVENSGNNKQA